jgi:DNA-binding NtrC family response regulator/tetratricopeptide (TPR) repeat protein
MDVLADLLGQAPAIAGVREHIRGIVARIAQARRLPPILIEGETGTGKNLVARTIHRAGPRAGRPVVDVNCAAIPEGLLEAELFGFERGAFTDARQAKAGLFQAARAGTIFLDEIALLSDALQAKLLTVIDERVVRRLGSIRSEPVDVCLIAATNENLLDAVRARRFRQDLYHRLAVLTLRLPPLRERPDDIPLLAEHFLERACRDYGLPRKVLAPAARDALCAYPWPGNVRELSNVMERVALLTETARILPAMLDLPVRAPAADRDLAAGTAPGTSLDARVETWEREELLRALEATGWKVARAAVRLGLTRGTIRYRIAKYGLEPTTRRRRTRRSQSVAGTPSSPAPVLLVPSAPVVLRWEDRLVAVLQASARPVDGDDVLAEFGRAFDVLVQKVEGFGGRVEEAGTARLVAAFGLDPTEDAPRRAALAAMAIQNALGRNRETQAARTPITVAVHADQCPVAEVSGRRRVDADAKRRMVSMLDALAADGPPDAILVSETARALLGPRFVVDDLSSAGEESRLGGRLRAYQQHRFGLGGDPGPFVGRERELAALESRWREAREGRGELVAVAGEPGIGKSRLLFEFARRRADERLIHLEGRGESYSAGVPYHPLVELLKSYLRVDDRDDPLTTAEKVRSHLLALDPALAPDVAPIQALLEAPVGDSHWQELEPLRRRQRTMDALKRLVLHASLAEPVLLVIEDLHWIDTETQTFLDRLVASLSSARLLVLVSYRPEYRHGWGGATGYMQLHLDPLPSGSAEELVQGLVGPDAALRPLRHLLVERTEGNPFFLEESVRRLVETHVLVGERGAYHFTQAVDTLQVPPTVRAVLAARIERLTPEVHHVLEAGAVVGKDVPFVLLQAIANVPDATLRDAVAELLNAEFFREAQLVPEIEYTFKHALTHEVAYGAVPADRRRSLHARMVETLEHLYSGRLTEQVERLAHHAQRAELWPKAVAYLRQAAAKAVARYANREAVSCLEQALGAVPHLPGSPETRMQAIDLRLDLYAPLVTIGGIERQLGFLREAELLAGELGDLYRMGCVAAYMTHMFMLTGLSEPAVAGERALAIARKVGNLGLEALAGFRLGQAYRWRGEYTRAIAAFKWGINTLVGDLQTQRFGIPGSMAVMSRVRMGESLAEIGEFPTAIAWVDEALRMAEALDDRHGLAMAQWELGLICLRRGDPTRALPWLERSFDGSQRQDFEVVSLIVAGPLGEARAACGATGEAIAFLEQAAQLATAVGAVIHLPGILGALAEAHLLAGRRVEARHAAERMLQLTRTAGHRHGEGEALRILGEIRARANPVETGPPEESYRDALSIADRLGTRPLAAHCHLGLGKLYRRTGKREQAQEHLTTATTMYREMGMTYWLEKAETELQPLT